MRLAAPAVTLLVVLPSYHRISLCNVADRTADGRPRQHLSAQGGGDLKRIRCVRMSSALTENRGLLHPLSYY